MDATNSPHEKNVFKTMWDLVRRTIFPLPEINLSLADEAVIGDVLTQHSGEFVKQHKLRSWKVDQRLHIEMHLTVPEHMTLRSAHNLRCAITDKIHNRLDHSLVVHIEPCQQECAACKEKWSRMQLPKHQEGEHVPTLAGKERQMKAGCPFQFWSL